MKGYPDEFRMIVLKIIPNVFRDETEVRQKTYRWEIAQPTTSSASSRS